MTNRAFSSPRGLTGGLALLLMGALATVGLSACGAPSYTYVSNSAAKAYYKVPSEWHQISQKDLNAALSAAGMFLNAHGFDLQLSMAWVEHMENVAAGKLSRGDLVVLFAAAMGKDITIET